MILTLFLTGQFKQPSVIDIQNIQVASREFKLHGLCDVGAMLYQLNYEASWEQVKMPGLFVHVNGLFTGVYKRKLFNPFTPVGFPIDK